LTNPRRKLLGEIYLLAGAKRATNFEDRKLTLKTAKRTAPAR